MRPRKTAATKPRAPKEEDQQIEYFQMVDLEVAELDRKHACNGAHTEFWRTGFYMIHSTPNERKCPPWVGAKFKRMGLRPGYPDISIDVPVGHYAGARIEMKKEDQRTKGGKEAEGVRESQQKWHSRLVAQGYYVGVAFTAKEAWEMTCAYLQGTIDRYGKKEIPEMVPGLGGYPGMAAQGLCSTAEENAIIENLEQEGVIITPYFKTRRKSVGKFLGVEILVDPSLEGNEWRVEDTTPKNLKAHEETPIENDLEMIIGKVRSIRDDIHSILHDKKND